MFHFLFTRGPQLREAKLGLKDATNLSNTNFSIPLNGKLLNAEVIQNKLKERS